MPIGKEKGEGEAKLVEAIRASEGFVPELSLVAVAHEIIRHILFSMISIETQHGDVPTVGLAPMAVKPECQNQGIGSKLVREGLRKCEELGFAHVFVLGHPGFYPRFGFTPAKTRGIESPFPVPDEVFMVYEIKPGSLDGIKGKGKYKKRLPLCSGNLTCPQKVFSSLMRQLWSQEKTVSSRSNWRSPTQRSHESRGTRIAIHEQLRSFAPFAPTVVRFPRDHGGTGYTATSCCLGAYCFSKARNSSPCSTSASHKIFSPRWNTGSNCLNSVRVFSSILSSKRSTSS